MSGGQTGKLYKKIKKIRYLAVFLYLKEEQAQNITGLVSACMDEAKAEYQTIFQTEYHPDTTIPEINRILNYKQQEWFKKWFGKP